MARRIHFLSMVGPIKQVLGPRRALKKWLLKMLQIRPNVIKLFTNVIYEFYNKVQCLSLTSLSSAVKCLQVRPDPTE